MRLLYYKASVPNFGDDLNADLWPRLAPDLFAEENDQGFQGIGTIIGMKFPEVSRIHVFSSGVGYLPTGEGAEKREVWCVRGPLSAKQLGLDPSKALTDGAILSPLIFPKTETKNDTVVIPHWETLIHNDWQSVCAAAGMRLIDPMQSPHTVINQISSAGLVLTESLHGAIIADTFGIPWIPFTTNGSFSVFKWTDWTRSVKVPLKLTVLAPPSGEVIYRLGKPSIAGFGETIVPSEAQLQREIDARITTTAKAKTASAKGGLMATAKLLAKQGVLKTPLAGVLGISPGATLRQLKALATQAPNLSEESHRTALRDEMLTRLTALCQQQGVTLKISA